MTTNSWCIKILFIALLSCSLYQSAAAQQADIQYLGEPRPAGWVPVELGRKPDSVSVWIQSGTGVLLDENAAINSMLIDEGASFGSAGYILWPVAQTAYIVNNGTIGYDYNDSRLSFQITKDVKSFTLMGSGKANLASIRPFQGSSSLQVNIQQDVALSLFTALPLGGKTASDNITFTIAAGKTVKLKNSDALFHHALQDSDPAGKYTYNINGTMDASATGTRQRITPLKPANSVVTMNISGVLKLSSYVTMEPYPVSTGKLVLNVLNGGVVDATATSELVYGNNYFTTHGTGVLKRFVSSPIAFPVGAPGSTSSNPLVIHDSKARGNYSVSVKNQFDVAPPNSTKVVNKQWTIIPENPAGDKVLIQPLWNPNDVAAGFSYNAPMAIFGREAGSNDWFPSPATKDNWIDPYLTQGAIASFIARSGVIIVQNTGLGAAAATVSLYPNPTSDVVNVDFPETTQESTIQITTYQGRDVAVEHVKKGATNWKYNISSWPAGFYFLKMKDGKRESAIKFVKK